MTTQGFTIAQAAKLLGVSPKTIRRHIKDGKIPHQLIQGKYGEEYRILELPGDLFREGGQEDTADAEEARAQDSASAADDAPGVDTTPAWALDMINGLQKTNLQLAGQLGAAQERIRELESQVKLLAMPKQPWWRRTLKKLGIG